MLQVDDPIASLGLGEPEPCIYSLRRTFFSPNEYPQWMLTLLDFEVGSGTYLLHAKNTSK